MKTLNQLNDEVLVKLYQDGNNEAFETLLLRYKSKVYAYIFNIVRNTTLSEDLFQDTFIKAIVNIQQGKYTDNGKFLGWINRIAHNLIIDYFRKAKSENTISSEDTNLDFSNSTLLTERSIEEIMLTEQLLIEIRDLVDYLPETQKQVIKMRFFEDLSFKEIAEKTDVNINTALGRMRYAMLNLKKLAQKYDVKLEII